MNGSYWERVAGARLTRRRALGALAASGASAALLAACGGDESNNEKANASNNGDAASSGPPQPGGSFGTYLSAVANYNVVQNYHEGYSNSGITAYDRPITTKVDGSGYNLEAMAKIEMAEPTRVVLTLRPDMVYQNKAPVNGRKVLASDIVATQEYVKSFTKAQDATLQRTFLQRIEAPNDTTVVMHFSQPQAYLFNSTGLANPTAQPIIPKETLETLDSAPPIGSGPYELVDHTFGQKYTWRKFENFREAKRGMPYITERTTLVFTNNDPVPQEVALRGGQVSEFLPPSTIVDRLLTELDKSRFANATFLNTLPTGILSMMDAQAGGPRPWHDIRVREALYRVTNKDQWVQLGFDGKAVPNRTPLPENLEAWLMDPKVSEPFYKEDIQKANQLLSAANYDKNQEWEIICSSQSNALFAEIWQQQLSRIGFKVRVAILASAQANTQKVFPAQFDFRVGQYAGSDNPANVLRNQHSETAGAGGQGSHHGLYNKEIDALIEKSEAEPDRNANIKLVKDIQKKVLDLYTMSLYTVTDQRYVFYDARLRDYIIDPYLGQDYQYQAWLKQA